MTTRSLLVTVLVVGALLAAIVILHRPSAAHRLGPMLHQVR